MRQSAYSFLSAILSLRFFGFLGYDEEVNLREAIGMDEYIGIVKIERTLGHTLLLQDYTSYFYLRVENTDDGWPRCQVRLSRKGEVLKDYIRGVSTEQDFTWVRWAQNLIEKKQVK